MAWKLPRPDRGDPESNRINFLSLQEFLKNPSFANGVGLGDGSPPTYDPSTGVTVPPPTTPLDQGTIDGITAALPPDDGADPSTVTGLTLTAGINSIFARWDASSDSDVENGWGQYRVQLDNTNNTFPSPEVDKVVGGTFTSFTGLTTGTTYYVRVKAVDAYGNESASWSTVQSTAPIQVTGPDIAANTITAANIFANTITAAEIAADTITAEELDAIAIEVGKYIQSDNYDGTDVATGDATQGFRFEGNGNGEMQNARIRGTVIAGNSNGTVTLTSDVTYGGVADFEDQGGSEWRLRVNQSGTSHNLSLGEKSGTYTTALGLGFNTSTGVTTAALVARDVTITSGASGSTILAGARTDINTTRHYDNGVQQPRIHGGPYFGVSTGSGGSAGDITFAHGMTGAPSWVQITVGNHQDVCAYVTNVDGTNITVNFRRGTTNVAWSSTVINFYWTAGYYA